MVTKMTDLRKTGPIIILIYFSGQLTQTLKDGCHVCRIPGKAFVLELEAKKIIRVRARSNSSISGVFCYLRWTGLDLDNRLDSVGRPTREFREILDFHIFFKSWVSGKWCNLFVLGGSGTIQKLKNESGLEYILIPSFPGSLASGNQWVPVPPQSFCRESPLIEYMKAISLGMLWKQGCQLRNDVPTLFSILNFVFT